MNSNAKFNFGTKAETLDRLRTLLDRAKVLPSVYFSISDLSTDSAQVERNILSSFSCPKLIVRSSAKDEDGANASMAGAFLSVLNVDRSLQAIRQAFTSVKESLGGSPADQILVQEMIEDSVVSGVITSFCLSDGAPYYVINYDDKSGKTDTITGGKGETNKTVVVYRNTDLNMIESARVRRWLELAIELEEICGEQALDIEFGQRQNGDLILFQVRRIATQSNWNLQVRSQVSQAQIFIEEFVEERSRAKKALAGKKTILGIMPDWNPAEIIGTTPRPLAISLYQYLVTDSVWREARGKMGYHNPKPEQLMLNIAGRPFIDVRNSFNSFLPGDLRFDLKEKIVNAWLERLHLHPEFHDKVEFEIAQTVYDFSTEEEFENRYHGILSSTEKAEFFSALKKLTVENIDLSENGHLPSALRQIEELEKKQKNYLWSEDSEMDLLANIDRLLIDGKEIGTFPFAIIARHAFMAESLLRALVHRKILGQQDVLEFKSKLKTVTTVMAADLQKVQDHSLTSEDFFLKYGHLRPGTYDIQSLRYDQRPNLFQSIILPKRHHDEDHFVLQSDQKIKLAQLLSDVGFKNVTPEIFFEFAAKAIVGREHAKFIFTKNLSDALELISRWGERIGLDRDDLSYLKVNEILEQLMSPIIGDRKSHFKSLIDERKSRFELSKSLYMNYLIRDAHDIYVVPLHRGAPNFVTSKRIEAKIILLDSHTSKIPDLRNAIVCIENADPGFDWIFTRGIVGLITKFGGSNSHMAIRCAEFGLPAAIGCGEQTFERLVQAGRVDLNCESKSLRAIYE